MSRNIPQNHTAATIHLYSTRVVVRRAVAAAFTSTPAPSASRPSSTSEAPAPIAAPFVVHDPWTLETVGGPGTDGHRGVSRARCGGGGTCHTGLAVGYRSDEVTWAAAWAMSEHTASGWET